VSSTLFVDMFRKAGTPISVVRAIVARTVTSYAEPLFVTVPAFDGGAALWGPCTRCPADTLPQAGEECLLLLTQEDQTPWALVSSPVWADLPSATVGYVLTNRGDGLLPDWEKAVPGGPHEEEA